MIREAEERDIGTILNLLTQVNKVHVEGRPDIFKADTKYDRASLTKKMENPDEEIFVYEDEETGDVLGYAFTVLQQASPDHPILTDILTLYIDDICVDENARGKHVGSELYNAALEYARDMDCHNVTLNVWTLNDTAQKFYESMGMVPLRTTMEQVL